MDPKASVLPTTPQRLTSRLPDSHLHQLILMNHLSPATSTFTLMILLTLMPFCSYRFLITVTQHVSCHTHRHSHALDLVAMSANCLSPTVVPLPISPTEHFPITQSFKITISSTAPVAKYLTRAQYYRHYWIMPSSLLTRPHSVLVFKCLHGSAPVYLADELSRPADSLARCRHRSASFSFTGRSSNSPYDRGWSVISGRCVTYMEQSSTERHHVTFPSSL